MQASKETSDLKTRKKHKIKVKRLQNSPYAISESETLGRGSFSVIKKAYNIENPSQQLAVKIISIADQQSAVTIKSELQMLKQLPHHPNLVNNVKIQISTQKNFYVFMELCNQGNLQKYIHCHTAGSEDICEQKIWFFLKQITEGYAALYQKNIVHRDMKPQNILIKNGDFKIGDFGLSKTIKNVEILTNMSSKGTPLYMAPQLHMEKEGNAKVDVFSLGVILYRLSFKGKFPFFEKDRSYHSVTEYFRQLMIKKLVFPKNHTRSQQLTELIERMLMKNPEERICWKQIFQMEKIKRAVRNERRKQMITMEEFKKSLLIANTSIAKVERVQEETNLDSQSVSQNIGNKETFQDKKETYLMIEEAFNKKDRSNLEQKIYHNKLLYTLIDIANRRIGKVLQQQEHEIHPYIKKQIQEIILSGIKFSLYIISRLQDISGDWSSINKGELLNFEDIFDSDREIILEKLKKKDEEIWSKFIASEQQYIVGTYEDKIYHFATQYFEYPKQTKTKLKIVMSFLLEIYDLVIKYHYKYQSESIYSLEGRDSHKQQQEETWLEKLVMGDDSHKFEDYLFKVIQECKSDEIVKKMRRMGLLIL